MILKNLKYLLLITAFMLAIALILYSTEKTKNSNIDPKPLIENFDEILLVVSYIEFSNQDEKAIIEKINNQWILTTADGLPANTDILSKFFIQLKEASILELKTNKNELLYKLALDPESKTTLSLKSETGEELLILDIGTFNYLIPGTYVKMNNSSQSYVVSSNLGADVSNFYWIPNDLVNIGSEKIQSVQIYGKNMINLVKNEEGNLIHQNLPYGFEEINEDKVSEVLSSLTDMQHNDYMLRTDLPRSPNIKARYTFDNGTVLSMDFYDIPDKGIHATFDWNYLADDFQISKFIDPDLSGSQLQISTLSLLKKFAFNVPQQVYDKLNIKLREKTE